jgi:3-hydroxyisobutyrate dehydrogenase
MKVGIAGLGRMGSIFAERLLAHGLEVHVWNRSEAAVELAVVNGAKASASPAELGSKVDIVLVSLADEQALERFYRAPDGLLQSRLENVCVIETSTVRPVFTQALGADVEAAGATFIDAPPLGTVAPARDGKLIFVAGGSESALETVRPVLDLLGRRIVAVGPIGSGSAMKLVVNLCLCVYFGAIGEALLLADRRGLDTETVLDVLMDSAIGSLALRGKIDTILGRSGDVAFDLSGARKDLAAAVDTLGEGFAAPEQNERGIAQAALARFDDALRAGWGDRDVASIVNLRRA